MTDDRPRPQYGEYATPEQQAKAMGQVHRAPSEPSIPPPPDPSSRVAAPIPASVRSGFSGDRFATIFLLGIGFFAFLTSISGDLNLAAQINQTSATIGGGNYSDPGFANRMGILLLVVNAVTLLGTAIWALRWMARGRRAFYIPIVGFLVFSILAVIIVGIVFSADPSIMSDIEKYYLE
jgi:hypothetical protein